MAEQIELLESYTAQEIAKRLQDALDTDTDDVGVLTAFHEAMRIFPTTSYAALQIVGMGVLHEVFVWKMEDKSSLIVGWISDEEIAVGILPPEAVFTPVPYADGKQQTLH
jgi:hypothetical protein